MADPVPARVETIAESLDLGELHGVFTGPSNTLYVLMWWGYAFIIGGPGVVTLGGSEQGTSYTVPLGVLLTLCGAAMAWRGIQIIRHRRLYLYTGGIVYTHPSGKAKWYGTWPDVEVYWGQGTARGSESYRIVFPQGGKVRWGVFTTNRDPRILSEGVGGQARKLSAARILPIALEQLRAGEMLEFGPIHVDSKGLIYRTQDLPWREVTAVRLLGRIALQIFATKKRHVSVPFRKIPNLTVLLRLIEISRNP